MTRELIELRQRSFIADEDEAEELLQAGRKLINTHEGTVVKLVGDLCQVGEMYDTSIKWHEHTRRRLEDVILDIEREGCWKVMPKFRDDPLWDGYDFTLEDSNEEK